MLTRYSRITTHLSILLLAMLCGMFIEPSEAASPTWAVDPAVPGPDVPSAGMSAFDAVTLDAQGRRELPFPFAQLISRLEAAAGCTNRERCTHAVLIPLGRSLQRVAASPNFFAHPRIVAAVTEEGSGGQALRDRLFLGYQDAQGVIEVISYNEVLGRFEFQIVKNYREGAQPQVFQGRRAICLSCHQNHGPIFSRQVWSETNANPGVATALSQHAAAFSSVSAKGASETSNALDDSTDRANRYALTQVLWRDGCGVGEMGRRCRRAAMVNALRFALSGGRASLDDQRSSTDLVAPLQTNAVSRWPGGLAVPNPDIPNRDPFSQHRGSEGSAVAHIPAKLEPLALRSPLEVLPPRGDLLAAELVQGMAATWSSARLATLDRALLVRRAKSYTRETPCRIERRSAVTAFFCGDATTAAMELSGSFDTSSVSLDSIRIGDEQPIRYATTTRAVTAHQHASFVPLQEKRSLRTTQGAAIASVQLRWSGSTGMARVTIRDDFDESLIEDRSLDGVFSIDSIDGVIAKARGVEHRPCCAAGGTSAQVEVTPPAVNRTLAAALDPHCGSCHRTADAMPANFLSGDEQRVTQQLATCAPRIYVRLSMTHVPLELRAKTPMPPESSRRDARADRAIARLREQVASLLREEYGRLPTVDELLSPGYERLRPCLESPRPFN
jgi:hypothetical protein